MKQTLWNEEEDNTQTTTGSPGAAAGDVADANSSPPEGKPAEDADAGEGAQEESPDEAA